jgi:Na+-driven multidrug efflux pump
MCFDMAQGFIQGPIKGLGMQFKASILCIACHWLLSLPSAYIFAFVVDMGVEGLLVGIGVGTFAQCMSYAGLMHCAKWEQISEKVY